MGDRWSLLIVRDAFDGTRRFGDFQRSLGVARNILSDRLHRLVDAGILETRAASDGSAYQEYVLTAKGESLFTVVVALRQWGEVHLFARGERHSQLIDKRTGKPIPFMAITAAVVDRYRSAGRMDKGRISLVGCPSNQRQLIHQFQLLISRPFSLSL